MSSAFDEFVRRTEAERLRKEARKERRRQRWEMLRRRVRLPRLSGRTPRNLRGRVSVKRVIVIILCLAAGSTVAWFVKGQLAKIDWKSTPTTNTEEVDGARSPNQTPLRTIEVLMTPEWSDAVMIPSGQRIEWTRADRTVPYEVRTSTERTPVEILGIPQTSLIERRGFADTESVQFRTTDPSKQEVWMRIEFFPY